MSSAQHVSASLVLAAVVGLGGCVSIGTNAANPTAVERQLLGAYEELDRELVMAASVRGDVRGVAGSWDSMRALALEGRALMRFNQDDVRELKTAGCLAETLEAELAPQPCTAALADVTVRVARVVAQENRARRAVITFAAYASARESGRTVVSPEEVAELRRAYHRLMRQTAATGDLFETEPGRFAPVE